MRMLFATVTMFAFLFSGSAIAYPGSSIHLVDTDVTRDYKKKDKKYWKCVERGDSYRWDKVNRDCKRVYRKKDKKYWKCLEKEDWSWDSNKKKCVKDKNV